MIIREVKPKDASILSEFYVNNHDHLAPWEPARDKEYHSIASWSVRLLQWEQQRNLGGLFSFVALSDEEDQIWGHCTLSGISGGVFQACFMGYGVDKNHEGKGVMTSLCHFVLKFAFGDLKLNRVMANYMPSNKRSAHLLKKLGFETEGYAKKYLMINGQWEDHVLTALLNEDYNRL
ncbi:GNAT family N-acetyltransferase [Spirochaeta cellobiosiphila]|uniref:GNAT family N-acetyltransferase n=1 Tax=Spirochaeta cellobiosiphila TaxID=504483 RepID=UPI0003F63D24|nr:GNAT family N-acetyltransferase [Spirochaeta cellobiosiphila]